MRQFSTPMMQQYMTIRQQYADCMLFFRLGDFYELFLDDALEGARILGITLTRRPRGKDGDIPMAGVPFHSADTYIAKLLKSGKKVAICEQVSEPDTKGIVDRKVIRIITPGTVLDDRSLEQKQHNYVASIEVQPKVVGVALADVLTGDFHVTQFERDANMQTHLGAHLLQFAPSECVVSMDTYNSPELLGLITAYHQPAISYLSDWKQRTKNSAEQLAKHFSIGVANSLGFMHLPAAVNAAAGLLAYLDHTQQSIVTHLQKPQLFVPEDYVVLDPATIANLELFSTLHEQRQDGSLLQAIDTTQTAAGGRLLRSWLLHPQKKQQVLEQRYQAVGWLYKQAAQRTYFQTQLRSVFDLERLVSKLALGIGSIASLLNSKQSLQIFLELAPRISETEVHLFQEWRQLPIAAITKVTRQIDQTLAEVETETGELIRVIKDGVNTELDELRLIVREGETWIAQFEKAEKAATGIPSLKCRYNSVFGYYIEVSQSYVGQVPAHYQRKQTLVNAERFITPELKLHEEKILAAQERIAQLEREIFNQLVALVTAYLEPIKAVTAKLAELDVLCNFAQIAQERRYVQPELVAEGSLQIIAGKHPVLAEKLASQFVPNDVLFNDKSAQLLVITGPNMAGKSVFMRQVALLVLLAQSGSFVPAKAMQLPLVDRIFVRSGAADNISRGLSTFMVEMVEAATILHQATSRSLVIMDEIGRGTSTYDGISIAWAIAEYLVTHPTKRPKVLFATHYHELQALADQHPETISNFQVLVENTPDSPLFLYTVAPGAASHSFGIAVAKLAGLPPTVLERAQALLDRLEMQGQMISLQPIPVASAKQQATSKETVTTKQASQAAIFSELRSCNIAMMTPLEALQKLDELHRRSLQE